MAIVTIETKAELITTQNISPIALFSGDGMDAILREITDHAKAEVPNLETAKGRKAIASMAAKVAKSKTYLDGLGKDLVADQKASIKLVDEERKRMREHLDNLKVEVRKPLTDWEDAEKMRVEYHRSIIKHIQDCGLGLIGGESQSFGLLFTELEEKIIIDESFEEFEAEAHQAKTIALTKLRTAFEDSQKRAAEQAELERLCKEKEERDRQDHNDRIAREAAESARKKAEQKAIAEQQRVEKERQEAIQREEQAKQQALEAERAQIAAEERARIQAEEAEKRMALADAVAKKQAETAAINARNAEILNQEAKEAAELAEQEKREANKRHVGKIRKEAKESLIALGLSEDQAKAVVLAINAGKIANVSISY